MDEMTTLRMAREAIHQGDKVAGQSLILEVLRENPRNETAWLWLSAIIGDPAKERDCLEQVLKINPDNETAKEYLAKFSPFPDVALAARTPEPASSETPAGAQAAPPIPEGEPSAAQPSAPAKPPASAPPAPPPPFQVTSGSLSRTERTALLDEQIRPYVDRGFAVQSRTATTAQLIKKKRFSVLAAVLFALTGVGLILYLVYLLGRRNERAAIEIDPQGNVLVTKRPKYPRLWSVLLVMLVVALLLLLAIVYGVLGGAVARLGQVNLLPFVI